CPYRGEGIELSAGIHSNTKSPAGETPAGLVDVTANSVAVAVHQHDVGNDARGERDQKKPVSVADPMMADGRASQAIEAPIVHHNGPSESGTEVIAAHPHMMARGNHDVAGNGMMSMIEIRGCFSAHTAQERQGKSCCDDAFHGVSAFFLATLLASSSVKIR